MHTIIDRRSVASESGTSRWEYQRRYKDGVSTGWVTETETLDSVSPLLLDTFHTIWNLHPLNTEHTQAAPRSEQRTRLSRKDALAQFPIGTRITGSHTVVDRQIYRVGQVYDLLFAVLAH